MSAHATAVDPNTTEDRMARSVRLTRSTCPFFVGKGDLACSSLIAEGSSTGVLHSAQRVAV